MAIEQAVVNHPDFYRGLPQSVASPICRWFASIPGPAAPGGFPDEEGRHVAHTFCWLRTRPFDNLYAHPIEGLNAVVDVKTCMLIRIDDHGNDIPIPAAEVNYEARFRDSFRAPMKPLDVVQPQGPSFTLDGHQLSWDRWSLVVGVQTPARALPCTRSPMMAVRSCIGRRWSRWWCVRFPRTMGTIARTSLISASMASASWRIR